ncbi:MAG TPA: type II toxin-antitoxin system RelE/ParE family toxin [Allosphingosinicella sp.]|nr:type II toxin-antitoxin system RelE/ParE family toxin [Allosphingosinicella sp.]
MTDDECAGLITYLAQHPDGGLIIPETGGIRKLRWGAKGRGKRGGARVVYYFRDLNMPLYLLTVYGKDEKMNLTKKEKAQLRDLVDQIVKEYWDVEVEPRISRLWHRKP